MNLEGAAGHPLSLCQQVNALIERLLRYFGAAKAALAGFRS
jgi:hypothetical protein